MVSFALMDVLLYSMLLSFLSAFIATPFIMRNSRKAGILGVDRNKKGLKLPEMGGIAIVAGTSMGILAAITLGFNLHLDIQVLLAALSTVVIMGILGMIDDLYALQQKIKAPIPFIAAVPLSAVRAGTRTVNFPFIGSINFGSLYPLALVPIGVGGASNAFNMLAGLNGLEAGMGLVISAALLVASYSKGAYEAALISASLFSACLAFLYYNKYPAKIFPGDVGTYTIGATIASIAIIGNLEFFGLVLFLPYLVEFLLKARTRFRGENYGTLKDGMLVPPEGTESLTHVVMRLSPQTEGQVVQKILFIEIAVSVFALAFFL